MWTWMKNMHAAFLWWLCVAYVVLHSKFSPRSAWTLFSDVEIFSQLADKSESGSLEDQEFVEFYKMLTKRTEVLDLFEDYSSNGQSLSQCDLEEFLREEQLEGEGSYKHALQLIDRYEPSDTGNDQPSTTIQHSSVYIYLNN